MTSGRKRWYQLVKLDRRSSRSRRRAAPQGFGHPAVGLILAILLVPRAMGGPTPDILTAIRAATFEVVLKKPEKDPLTYEKPLPLELIPFSERTDAFESVGTAFAIGHNAYLTAAHVLTLGVDSQYGAPALRSADGKVYAINRILKFSEHEDFAVFSVAPDPDPPGFETNRAPRLGDPVLAVGNALGDGVVVRDGLFTSETPEEQDGRWKWIRFSAAASPGNSGGPLLDAQGKVIGIITRKSPNENLNFALPIGRVLDAAESRASFDQRLLSSLAYMNGTKTYGFKDEFALPLDWTGFSHAYQVVRDRHNDEARSQLLAAYADSAFPRGRGSESIVYADGGSYQYGVVMQQANNQWAITKPKFDTTELPGDGVVEVASIAGATYLHIVRSDDAEDDGFYSDSKASMDLALRGLEISREVGSDDVRVTSLGPAQSESLQTDPFGRKWQLRTWALPYRDAYVLALLLPTPDGYVGLVKTAASANLRESKVRLSLLANQFTAPYRGTLRQWQSYLRRRALLPECLKGLVLQASPVWKLHTTRFEMSVPAALMNIDAKSRLMLTMGFMYDGPRLAWDVNGAWWYQDERNKAWVGLWREPRPPQSARLELRNMFDDLRAARSPYDAQPVRVESDVFDISLPINAPGSKQNMASSEVMYCLSIRIQGNKSMDQLGLYADSAREGTHILERAVGEDVSYTPAQRVGSVVDEQIQHMRELAAQADKATGRDIRGRSLSEDIEEYLVSFLKLAVATPVGSTTNARRKDGSDATGVRLDTFESDITDRARAIEAYWAVAPALLHNRDLWRPFLARNHLPENTAHSPQVRAAESSLADAFGRVPTGTQWVDRAQALLHAYVEERRQVASNVSSDARIEYKPRHSPCPPPAAKTSGRATPVMAPIRRSLEDLYPPDVRQQSVEGAVILGLQISSTGCITGAAVVGSSGSDSLDQTALEWISSESYFPAEIDGKASDAVTRLSVTFKLQE